MIARMAKRTVPFLLALMLFLPIMAHAAQLDLTQTGSISVQLRDAAFPATSVTGTLELYKVGDAVETNGALTFVPTADFASAGISLSDTRASGLAQALADYAKKQHIPAASISTASGAAVFSDLSTGLFLLIQTEAADGYLPVSPFLVSLPMYSAEDGGWNYQIAAAPKVQPVPKEPTALTVIKKWKDNSSADRPAQVEVALLQDGAVSETVTLNKENNWTHTWNDLDPHYVWTVEEAVPAGYTAAYSTKGQTTTITNTSDTYEEPDTLAETGQLNWPVPALFCAGLVLIITGLLLLRWRKQGL